MSAISPDAPDLSVIVATRNRAETLRETLGLLAAQETGGAFTYEVLVMDNGSADHTRQVVEAQRRGGSVEIRYLYEGAAGKPRALNAGIARAGGPVLVFTDDDMVMGADWLQAIWSCFQEEQADGVTGRVLPAWQATRPAWLTDEVVWGINWMGCLDHGPHRKRASLQRGQDCRWVGGNMAVRRAVLERIGGFDVRLLCGEDTELYERCVRAGRAVYYEPRALAYHKITADRMTIAYVRRWHHRYGYHDALLLPWKPSHLLTIMPLWRVMDTLRLFQEWLTALVRRRPWWERFYGELKLRREASLWLHRLQLWPRWWLAMLMGRSASFRRQATDAS